MGVRGVWLRAACPTLLLVVEQEQEQGEPGEQEQGVLVAVRVQAEQLLVKLNTLDAEPIVKLEIAGILLHWHV